MQPLGIGKRDAHRVNAELDPDEVDWKGVRFLDPVGRVFEHEGEIYRAIYPGAAPHVRSLLDRGVVGHLVESGLLVDTSVASTRMPGYAMVLHHGRIPHLSRPGQWPRSLVRDAARLVVELNLELRRFGLGTVDFHPGNIEQLGCCRPIWIDLGSIQPLRGEVSTNSPVADRARRRVAILHRIRTLARHGRLKDEVARRAFLARSRVADVPAEFRSCFLYPLSLFAQDVGWGRAVRLFLDGGGIRDTEYRLLGGGVMRPRFRREGGSWLDDASAWLDALEFPPLRTDWGRYYDQGGATPAGPGDLDPRAKAVSEIVREHGPRKVVDLGCNTGRFSALASRASPGADVYAVDSDEGAIEAFYANARGLAQAGSVTVALDDVLRLSRDPQRARGDFALALALTHHLYFRQHCSFPVIAELLAAFTDGALLTEFMPNGQGMTVPSPDPLPSDYRLETFTASLEAHFRRIEVIRSPILAGASPRILVHAHDRR